MEAEVLLKLWAKSKGKAPEEVLYPLLYHMMDVAMVAQEMWRRALHAQTRGLMAHSFGLADREASVCLSFWAGLHDIGKASPSFQSMNLTAQSRLESLGFDFESRNRARHEAITLKVFPHLIEAASPGSLPLEAARLIGRAIAGHHGVFQHADAGPRQRGEGMWIEARLALTSELSRILGVSRLPAPRCSLGEDTPYLMLAGLTAVTDWIASNEDFFPYEMRPTPDGHAVVSRQRAREAMQKLGWTEWRPPTTTPSLRDLFPRIIDNPYPLQEKVGQLPDTLTQSPGLVIIEAPMGEGKTEAAMYLADRWVAMLAQKGVYFALPTQATSNQMLGRVSDYLETRYPAGLALGLQLIHGGALLSHDFAVWRRRSTHHQDGDEVVASEWFQPKKRGLLAPFGVGTIDQALLSVLQTKHFFVRLFGLGQKTVVIDEVHAYDTYMVTLLEDLIGWLRALGSAVVLLSATLPERTRKALLRAYGADAEQLPASRYPRVTWASGTTPHVAEVEASRRIELGIKHLKDDLDVLVNELCDITTEGGCIAIVCNTVKRAQQTYAAIKEAGLADSGELMLLHARYPYEEREAKECAVLDAFSKKGRRPPKAILVSTQIIEQSLDIDFDLMVTDLAPVDLVIQRAGRVHRHANRRPHALSAPALWLRMPEASDGSVPNLGDSAYVYDRYILLLSYLSLANRDLLCFPEDIPRLIEEVYGGIDIPAPSPAFAEALHEAWGKMDREMRSARFKAQSVLVPTADTEPVSFFGSFSKELEEDNPEVHRSLQALTRLAEPSVQVVCLCKSSDLLFLHDGDARPFDLNCPPEGQVVVELLRRSLSITDKRVVFQLLEKEAPQAWRKCAPLRHHRLLEFENGVTAVGKYQLTLDKELGLSIEGPAIGQSEE